MTPAPATTAHEERVVIPCGADRLSGILTWPTVPANGLGVVFYAGRWSVTSVGRSRLFVYLARRLAPLGYTSLRLDYLGLGESTGQEQPWQLDRPFTAEPDAAVAFLAGRGITEVVVAGTCGGARLALDSTRRMDGVRGAVLMSPPVRDYAKGDRTASLPAREFLRRALRPEVLRGLGDARTRRRYAYHLRWKLRRVLGRGLRSVRGAAGGQAARGGQGGGGFEWVSPHFLDALEQLVKRGVPVLLFFGTEDAAYRELQRGMDGRLGRLLARAGDLVSIEVVEGRFHGLAQSEVGPASAGALEPWLDRWLDPAPEGPDPRVG